MDWEETCQFADAVVYANTGQRLTDVQLCILQGSLRGETYEEIAANSPYSVNYLKKLAGPMLWNLLSQGLGEPVSKSNFRATLARLAAQAAVERSPQSLPVAPPSPSAPLLVNVPKASVFFGRSQELDTLHHWLVADPARMILLSGMGGMGKTTLIASAIRQQPTAFIWVVMLTLSEAPTLDDLVGQVLSRVLPPEMAIAESPEARLDQLHQQLRSQRCLLVLDDAEMLLQSGTLTGQYCPEHEAIGDWLQQLTEMDHTSCVVVVGREQPSALMAIAGESLPVRHLKVRGLAIADAQALLAAKGVPADQVGIEDLIHMQRGNPLALQMVATTIQELFDGKVRPFLKQGTVLIGDTVQPLLQEQFDRLSAIEQGVMYWLALERQSLAKLRDNTRFLLSSPSELLRTLQSLKRRSLLEEETYPETEETLFTLQPLVLRYTIHQLIQRAVTELNQLMDADSLQGLHLFRSHVLFSDDPFYQLRHSQTRLMANAIMTHLQTRLGDRKTIQSHLNQILVKFQDKTTQAIGYAPTNLINLQRMLESQRL